MAARTALDDLHQAASTVDSDTTKLRHSRAVRDHHVIRAHAEGYSREAIAQAAHLSGPGVQRILARAGVTNPRLSRRPRQAA
ncbi:hypothetical protein DNL40_02500 [Xylanimonas oleitrophica]|uniref:Uncharacterized protein n=1 Tax=Xylanimonas oleitrophica TaxID=2607479 RepID=A0A2W5YJA9_9MICO|nr:hypothetical protein [Xylanimonas oleitrophica]PZR55261.1 hypothetical protein DNL40_02500 [Xylanimonas oleitrophica]